MLNEKSYYDIRKDLKESAEFNLKVNDIKQFLQGHYSGYFYPQFLNQINKYVYKTNKAVLDKLDQLKKHGIPLYIISNNSYYVGNILMTESIGPDWKDYFDVLMFETCKPGFFHKTDSPPAFKDHHENPIADFDEFIQRQK